jgi:hypothetical protein
MKYAQMVVSRDEKLVISLVIQLAGGIYLVFYDHTLYTFGILHYYALLGYLLLDVIFLIMLLFSYSAKIRHIVGFFSALGAFAMVLDAFFGLPLSKYSTTPIYGIQYLFGFGLPRTGSLFGTSLAFTILLLGSTATAFLATKSS